MTGSRRLPWRSGGIRTRIVLSTAALTLVGMAALLVLTALVLDRVVDATVRNVLEDRAAAVAVALSEDGPGETLDEDVAGATTWVFDGSGTPVHGPVGGAQDAAAARLAATGTAGVEESGDALLLARPLAGGAGTVVVAADLAPYETTRHLALLASGALGVLVVGGVTAGAAWTVTRALRPVSSMARSAASWSEHDLHRRFDLGTPHDEITELGAVLDGLLGRVAQVLVAEQRLTSELAHELRTPLTVIRAEAEVAAADPGLDAAVRERFDRIAAATRHLNGVIESLLSAARGSATTDVRTPVGALLTAATSSPALPPPSVAVVVEPAPGLEVTTPLDVALRALSPLLANAVQHGRHRVTVRAAPAGAWVAIDVEDDGPGVPETEREAVFAPGHRSPGSPGAGLGLPLSRRVARAAGGDVVLDPRHPSRFTLTLPAAR